MICFGNIKAFFSGKILEKFEYFARNATFLVNSKTIWVFLAGYIDIKLKLKEIIYITKASIFSSNADLATFFLLISFICLIVSKALAIV